MDMDKIITDLVEKRFNEELCIAVAETFDNRDGYKNKLQVRILEIVDEVIQDNADEIKKVLELAIKESVKIENAANDLGVKSPVNSTKAKADLKELQKAASTIKGLSI